MTGLVGEAFNTTVIEADPLLQPSEFTIVSVYLPPVLIVIEEAVDQLIANPSIYH